MADRESISENTAPAQSPARRGLLSLHAAVLLVAFAALFGKWIGVGAFLIVFGRLVFAIPALGAAIAWSGGSFRLPAGRERLLLIGNGLVLAVHWVSFFHSVQISTVAIALLGYCSAPVFAGLLEPLWYRESFSARSLLAAVLIVGGMVLIVPSWDWGDSTLQGMVWGLVSGFTFALLQLLNRRLVRVMGSLPLAFYLDLTAMVAMIPFLPLTWSDPSAADIGLMAVQGVVFTAVSHTLFIHALHSVQAQVVAIVGTLEPIYGIALAAWLLGEIPTSRTVVGGAVILTAVAGVTLLRTGWRLPWRSGASP